MNSLESKDPYPLIQPYYVSRDPLFVAPNPASDHAKNLPASRRQIF
jgi:hypothetical protein